MNNLDMMQFRADNVRFYSNLDEKCFFDWLGQMSCVQKVSGRGISIIIDVYKAQLDEYSIRDIISIFFRYKIPLSILKELSSVHENSWLKDRNSFWYSDMFLNN